jgi:hypothetical protein
MVSETRPSAFLEYVGEDAAAYRVRDGAEVETRPKSIRPVESQAADPSLALRQAGRYFLWALVGLLPAGLGALIFAPLAALAATRELRLGLEPANQRRALLILFLSVLVLLAALPLAYLFLLHW